MENFFEQNRKNLTNLIDEESVILLDSGIAPHKTADEFYEYAPQRNFYYLTGLNEANCKLMMLKGEKEVSTMLFIEETTEYMRQWVGEKITKEEASQISGIPVNRIYYLNQFEAMFRNLMTYARGLGIKPPKRGYFDLYRVTPTLLPVAYEQFKFIFDVYKELDLKNVNEHLSYLRMFKSEFEVGQLKKAISITNKGLDRILDNLKTRENEFQLAADFTHEITLEGSEGHAFQTIAASGQNATILHYEDNDSKIEKDGLMLFDLGALYQNYCSDISRTYPVSGVFSDRQKVLYEIVLKVNKESIQFVKPGITWNELNKFARDLLIEECKKINLIKEDDEINKYY
ncbi:MAG: Xaa-Pro peptidase family protein, partial [Firmicutes bacterium]|nr:Xaa-Pro peptidase family protein [Bacillota bacterium]